MDEIGKLMGIVMGNNDVVDAFLNISNSRLQVYNILRIFYFPERTPYFNCLSLNKAVTFSHQVHGSGSSVAYLQYRRDTPVNHRGGGEQGRHLQPPSAWIRVVRSLLTVPSRQPRQPPRWRRHWNCAICAHNTAFVGRPLLNGESVLLRKITNKNLGFPAAWKLLTITCTKI
ncbi:hypothetical protein CDAR_512851 [Caerostris darwini]|uniref:Uncharacterized protein n=1 Tax=Caerostris darwini TaxID=1538125 RepID=A0AAV4S8C8_9ARAC|nr:hypothetical protein CDAR_512851 [Caerostris darwini]